MNFKQSRNDHGTGRLSCVDHAPIGKCNAAEARIHGAIQAKIGETLRSQYELAQPLPDGLYQLVMELDRRTCERNRSAQKRNDAQP
jgi:hypothetical protein